MPNEALAALLLPPEPIASPDTAAPATATAGEPDAAPDLEEPVPTPEDEPPEPAATEPAPPPEGATEEWSLSRIAGTKDWTPDAIQGAASWVVAQQAKWARVAARSDRQARKAADRLGELRKERESWAVTRDQMIQDGQALRNGTPEQRLAALARVTGLRPEQVLEELTVGIAAPDKRPAPPQDKETRERLERLERALQDRATQEQQVAAEQAVLDGLQQGLSHVDQYPALAERVKAMGAPAVAGKLLAIMRDRYAAGQVLSVGDMLALADREEARVGTRTRQVAAVRDTAPKPDAGHRPAKHVTTQHSDAPGTRREKTPSEYKAEFARMLLGE